MGLQWIDQNLQSSVVLKAERICLSANDANRHDLTLGPVAHFGAMDRITGCGCIVNHQLERMVLSAELENTADANIVLRSASYGEVQMMFTHQKLRNGAANSPLDRYLRHVSDLRSQNP